MTRPGFTYQDSMYNLYLENIPVEIVGYHLSDGIKMPDEKKLWYGSFLAKIDYSLSMGSKEKGQRIPEAAKAYIVRSCLEHDFEGKAPYYFVPFVAYHIGAFKAEERNLLPSALAALASTKMPDVYPGYRANIEPLNWVLEAYQENKATVDLLIAKLKRMTTQNERLDLFVQAHKDFIEKHNGMKVIDRFRPSSRFVNLMKEIDADFFSKLKEVVKSTEKAISKKEAIGRKEKARSFV